ncbi:hypothetical protein GGX14DRAFT_580403 [Mycena pura]|uniref:Uncharacterized protein n=1 Tax=Mycena pura TaxID=153505 RepID=A0AAD6XVA1_9AGAR|nr:hypothetical protein GGX14DRAFT_581086 [Mycena pura]KAJ7189784.1 hypothetical protein GGX14DRAFT_580403 [Mycena pura]
MFIAARRHAFTHRELCRTFVFACMLLHRTFHRSPVLALPPFCTLNSICAYLCRATAPVSMPLPSRAQRATCRAPPFRLRLSPSPRLAPPTGVRALRWAAVRNSEAAEGFELAAGQQVRSDGLLSLLHPFSSPPYAPAQKLKQERARIVTIWAWRGDGDASFGNWALQRCSEAATKELVGRMRPYCSTARRMRPCVLTTRDGFAHIPAYVANHGIWRDVLPIRGTRRAFCSNSRTAVSSWPATLPPASTHLWRADD